MKNFNVNRFWQVLKWTLLTEKKSIFTAAVAFLCGFLAIQLFSCFTIFDITYGLGEAATLAGMVTCAFLISFMSAYYASGILGNARTSQQRVTVLMLPASNMEKYVARIVYCCIIMPLVLYLAAFAATWLRMLLEWMAGHDFITAKLSVLFDFGAHANNMEFSSLFNIIFYCWCTSLMVLGGVFFRTRPFIWSNVTIFLGSLLLFSLIFYICVLIGKDNVRDFAMNFKDMTFDTFELTVSLLFTVFTVLNIWLSYRLFCRLQVVQHKWFNV